MRQAQVGGPNPMTYYLVRSSALGGQAVTRLTAAGAKAYTYVPTEGVREVWQEVSSLVLLQQPFLSYNPPSSQAITLRESYP